MLIQGGRISSGTSWTVSVVRRVLDQLDQLVAVDHLARREREVAPRREGRGVDHAEPALLQVARAGCARRRRGWRRRSRRPGAARRGWTAAAGSGSWHRRTGCRWKSQPLPLGRRRCPSASACAQQPVGGEQVDFLQRPVGRVGVPLRRREPLVAAARLGLRRRCRAGPSSAPAASFQASTAEVQHLGAQLDRRLTWRGRGRPCAAARPSAGRGRPRPSRPGSRRAAGSRSTAGRPRSASGRRPGPCGAGPRPRTACRRRSRRAS